MIKYLCDKCGVEIDAVEKYTLLIDYPKLRQWGDPDIYTSREIHMCRDCMAKVKEAIKSDNVDCQSR